ncbi:MAG: response regulator transcription factor [Cyclobacteriaceae bacterium]
MKTIYIVDDNQMMREFLRICFEKEYGVKVFASGEEALAYMTSESLPDMLLLDYELEGLSGTEILKSIKASGFLRDVPVMFLSGKQKSEIRIECLQAGALDFVCKPFNPKELFLRVNKQLSLHN